MSFKVSSNSFYDFQLADVPSLQGIITAGTDAPAHSPLTEYNSLSCLWLPGSVLLPTWRPTRDSGALKAGTGPECQVLPFLISDAGWEKEAQISLSLKSEMGRES